MQDFNISNHPLVKTITRKAKLTGLHADLIGRVLTLDMRIKHWVDDVYIPEYDKIITSVANNDLIITVSPAVTNEQGEIITPAVIRGEFDYWDYLTSQGASLFTLLEQGILQMDNNGKINEKCGYKTE